jgi:PAS domain-containing protein
MKLPDKLPAISKNVFFGFGFVFFTSMILLLNWLFSLPVTRADRVLQQLPATEQKIHQLSALQSELLLNLEKETDLLSGNELRETVDDAFAGIRQDISFYRSFRLVTRQENLSVAFDNLGASTDRYRNVLRDLILAAADRGSATTGLISRWRTISGAMLTMAAKEKPEVIRTLEHIRQLENQYLLSGEQKTLDDILVAVNDVKAGLSGKEGGIPATDADTYLTLTNNLKSVDARLGVSTGNGLMQQAPADLSTVIQTADQIHILLNEQAQHTRVRWNLLRITMISLFTIAGILAVLLVTILTISKPLTRATEDLQQLAAGDVPDIVENKGGLPEMIRISQAILRIASRMKDMTAFARAVNADESGSELPLAGKNDALGKELNGLYRKIRDNAERQQRNEEENKRRLYINDGLAKFAEILRTGNTDITSLGDVFVRELVKYLGAIQGGLFLLDENSGDQPSLSLVSSFAYNRKKYLQKTVALGEGLVGTCAVEKQMINMTEIPKGYISISSGLGDAKPDNLLLLPVLHENDLVGVLEVASLKKYRDHELEFAREAAASLGSTLIYTRNNHRTAELLRKSQQQAQEMAEQEEEMRQNMEELKATQEESARREEELSGIAGALDRCLYVAHYDTDGRISDLNDRLCIFLGCNREDVAGMLHQEVFHGTLKPDAAFWEETEQSGLKAVTDKVKLGKKDYKLKFHFTPVTNEDGFVLRYIAFITDLTS